jgi:hypothetical protein
VLLISSHQLGPVAMDLNVGQTWRAETGTSAPRWRAWTASFGFNRWSVRAVAEVTDIRAHGAGRRERNQRASDRSHLSRAGMARARLGYHRPHRGGPAARDLRWFCLEPRLPSN